MEIALYENHHHLPFWHNPQQPVSLFDPRRDEMRPFGKGGEVIATKQTHIWPILLGLRSVEVSLLAHVSAFCSCVGAGQWHYPKRIWVQITTMPHDRDQNGSPIVVDGDGKVAVYHVWGGDNGTYSPHDLLSDAREREVAEAQGPEFWRAFFHERVTQARSRLIDLEQQHRNSALHCLEVVAAIDK